MIALPLNCGLCSKRIDVSYQPGPRPLAQFKERPWCRKTIDLNGIPGIVLSIKRRESSVLR